MSRAARALLIAFAWLTALPAVAATDVLIVTGLGGETRYADAFAAEAAAIAAAVGTLPGDVQVTSLTDDDANRGAIAEWFGALRSPDLMLVFLVGHGSFDESDYKFNIPGPDITDTELASWLGDNDAATQVVVLTGSASGAAATSLASTGRVIIAATRSGAERHATHFGRFFADGLSNPGADVDKNQRISAREAYDFAADAVAREFADAQQLATEHARLEGTLADRVTLARLDPPPARRSADPELARLRDVRDRISAEIDALRLTRETTPDALYRSELTRLLVDLAEAEEAIDGYEAAAQCTVGTGCLCCCFGLAMPALAARPIHYGAVDDPRLMACDRAAWSGEQVQANRCYGNLLAAAAAAVRAEAAWALGDRQAANRWFREALAAEPENLDVKVRWGELFRLNTPGCRSDGSLSRSPC